MARAKGPDPGKGPKRKGPKKFTVRLSSRANRLAQACAGLAGMSKPVWLEQWIERIANEHYPEAVARVEKNDRKKDS